MCVCACMFFHFRNKYESMKMMRLFFNYFAKTKQFMPMMMMCIMHFVCIPKFAFWCIVFVCIVVCLCVCEHIILIKLRYSWTKLSFRAWRKFVDVLVACHLSWTKTLLLLDVPFALTRKSCINYANITTPFRNFFNVEDLRNWKMSVYKSQNRRNFSEWFSLKFLYIVRLI